jgi:hypothetical protein
VAWSAELLTPTRVSRLEARTLDLGRLRPPVRHADLVGREPLVAVLPETHRLAAREAFPVEELAGEPLVAYPSHFRSVLRRLTCARLRHPTHRRRRRLPPTRRRAHAPRACARLTDATTKRRCSAAPWRSYAGRCVTTAAVTTAEAATAGDPSGTRSPSSKRRRHPNRDHPSIRHAIQRHQAQRPADLSDRRGDHRVRPAGCRRTRSSASGASA